MRGCGVQSRHLLVQCKALNHPNWSELAGFGGVFRCLGSKSGSKGEVKGARIDDSALVGIHQMMLVNE
jgi:hypothetical protein